MMQTRRFLQGYAKVFYLRFKRHPMDPLLRTMWSTTLTMTEKGAEA